MQQLAQRPSATPCTHSAAVSSGRIGGSDDGRLGGQVVADGLLVAEAAVEEGDGGDGVAAARERLVRAERRGDAAERAVADERR